MRQESVHAAGAIAPYATIYATITYTLPLDKFHLHFKRKAHLQNAARQAYTLDKCNTLDMTDQHVSQSFCDNQRAAAPLGL